jgi:hypothetical protein
VPVNSNKPLRWKDDISQSVDMYNDWFMRFAPKAYRDTRIKTTEAVRQAMEKTRGLMNLDADTLRAHPEVLCVLRMATCPPIALDRLIGLAGIEGSLVKSMEDSLRVPPKMPPHSVEEGLSRIGDVIRKLLDGDILVWVDGQREPTEEEAQRAGAASA